MFFFNLLKNFIIIIKVNYYTIQILYITIENLYLYIIITNIILYYNYKCYFILKLQILYITITNIIGILQSKKIGYCPLKSVNLLYHILRDVVSL